LIDERPAQPALPAGGRYALPGFIDDDGGCGSGEVN